MAVWFIVKIITISLIASSSLLLGFFLNKNQPTYAEYLVSRLENDRDISRAHSSSFSDSQKFKCKIEKYSHIDDECSIFTLNPELSINIFDSKSFFNSTIESTYDEVLTKSFFKVILNTHKLSTIYHGLRTIIEVFKKDDDNVCAKFKIEALGKNNFLESFTNAFLVKNISKSSSDFPTVDPEKNNNFSCRLLDAAPYTKCILYEINDLPHKIKNLDIEQVKELPKKGIIKKLPKDKHYIVRLSEKYLNITIKKNSKISFQLDNIIQKKESKKHNMTFNVVSPISLKFNNTDDEKQTTPIKSIFLL